MTKLTYEELVYRLDYNPDTGEFRWKNPKTYSKIKVGEIAGTLGPYKHIIIRINKKPHLAHRLAWLYMTGQWPENEIDHINNTPYDNRWCNLRLASTSENQCNSKIPSNNKSGKKNVYWVESLQKWRVHIRKNHKIYISDHKYYWQAVRKAIRMREQLHGEYHRHK